MKNELSTVLAASEAPLRCRWKEVQFCELYCPKKGLRVHQGWWRCLETSSRNGEEACKNTNRIPARDGEADVIRYQDPADAKKHLGLFKEAMDYVSSKA